MHRSNLTTLFVLPVAIALLLAAVPRDAEAQVCKILKSKREKIKKKNCVVPSDIKNESLTRKQVGDLAQTSAFLVPLDSMVLPRRGLVIINAVALIDGSASNGPVTVSCTIVPGPTTKNPVNHTVFDSVNPDNAFEGSFGTVVATKAYKVKKGVFTATFTCKAMSGSAKISVEGMSVRYIPTKY